MRIEGSITSVSWIPSEAVSGAYKVPFSVGVAQYDPPPPDPLGDIEALIREGRCRFCNDLRAFIDVEDGQIVGHSLVGDGFVGSTTLRFGRAAMTFALFVLPTLRANPRVTQGSVTFTQTCGARTGVAAPRPVKRPPYFSWSLPRHGRRFSSRCMSMAGARAGWSERALSAPLDLRPSGQAVPEEQLHRLQDLERQTLRRLHAVG